MSHKIPVSTLVVIYTPALEVLLLERADRPGFWQSVTGSQDAGESLPETAEREVAEETGLEAGRYGLEPWNLQNVYEIYPVWRHRYAPGVTHNTEHVFRAARAGPHSGARGFARGNTSPPSGCRGARRPTVCSRGATARPSSCCRKGPPDMPASRDLTVVTYNIHKGLSQFNRRLVLHDIRAQLASLNADVAFLQEVQGRHEHNARRHIAWPEMSQHEFLTHEGCQSVYGIERGVPARPLTATRW